MTAYASVIYLTVRKRTWVAKHFFFNGVTAALIRAPVESHLAKVFAFKP
jgi:hypothetical protein